MQDQLTRPTTERKEEEVEEAPATPADTTERDALLAKTDEVLAKVDEAVEEFDIDAFAAVAFPVDPEAEHARLVREMDDAKDAYYATEVDSAEGDRAADAYREAIRAVRASADKLDKARPFVGCFH